ncbi:hypothetical protein Leryth_005386 [Lithospermum erythrorhizon]|nr:hypothetical protein Leryth_005386 [Lithospermum erythrorhizon]
MFICGSFKEDDDIDLLSCPSPKSSSKRSYSFKKKETKNRFADRGLDKFYALMSELDEKKQKIFTQKGAEDITLVRFVISNDNEIRPIVVKVKEKRQSDVAKEKISISQNNEESSKIEKDFAQHENDQKMKRSIEMYPEYTRVSRWIQKIPEYIKTNWMQFDFKFEMFKQPIYYLPVLVMLVLLFLAIYGKSFAILCTSILWYLIPAIRGGSSSGSRKEKRPMKKEFTRRYSEITFGRSNKQEKSGPLTSPTSVINGPTDMLPGKKHGHRRSF